MAIGNVKYRDPNPAEMVIADLDGTRQSREPLLRFW
jgi:hypothetical protein